ncbi:MAG: hypothetical protein RSC81_12850 [Myroides sp.]
MRKVVLFGLFMFLSVSVNAQNSASVKENQPIKEFSDETKSLGEAEIIIFISVNDKEVKLPAYVKRTTSLKEGILYAQQLISDLKSKGLKTVKYDMTWNADGVEEVGFLKG